jgi:hypothetical protein
MSGLNGLRAHHASPPPLANGGGSGMFNAFGFSLFGGPSDSLGGFDALAAAAPKAVSDDGVPRGGTDQGTASLAGLMPVAASTLKLPAPVGDGAVLGGGGAGGDGALAAMVAGLNLQIRDLAAANTAGAAASPQTPERND